ncbi:DUF6037 family protein [Fluviicola sp.]|uniref:DUF6037 family protein n=1 Tax=Fluviicola sp. TaxID=1917219 RepID=UPI003D2AE30E
MFFYKSNTFLISHSNTQVAYTFSFNKWGDFSGGFPSEFYLSIHHELVKCTGSNKVGQIWDALDSFILQLTTADNEPHDEGDIKHYLGQTKTKDKKFDEEGEMPFFSNWRRNPQNRRASEDNLDKTERLFGKEIRKRCESENVSSVWSKSATKKSMDFLLGVMRFD